MFNFIIGVDRLRKVGQLCSYLLVNFVCIVLNGSNLAPFLLLNKVPREVMPGIKYT